MSSMISPVEAFGLAVSEALLQRAGRLHSWGAVARLGREGLRAAGAYAPGAARDGRTRTPRLLVELDGGAWPSRAAFDWAPEPTTPVEALAAGAVLLAARRPSDAARAFGVWAEFEPSSPWPRLLRAFARESAADAAGALDDYRAAATLAPGFGWPAALRARLAADLGLPGADADLLQAAQDGPGAGWLERLAAEAEARAGRMKAALALTRRALSAPLADPSALLARASWRSPREGRADIRDFIRRGASFQEPYYLLAAIESAQGRTAAARRAAIRGAELDRVYCWERHGTALASRNPRHGLPQELWPLAEGSRVLTAWRGQTRLLAWDLDGAESDLDVSCGNWAGLWRAEALRRRGRAGAALAALAALPRRFRPSWRGLLEGACLLARGEAAAALAPLEAVLSRDPWAGAGAGRVWLAEALWLTGRAAEAAEQLRVAAAATRWRWASEAAVALSEGRAPRCVPPAPTAVGADPRRVALDPGLLRARAAARAAALDDAGALDDWSRSLGLDLDPWDPASLRARAAAKDSLGDASAEDDRARAASLERAAAEARS